ncbi:ATP-dependent protease LonB [Archaeoglobus profundus]|uniref:Archaeal Lon protease n=1 Tax=Archaeoglobus profundus (strain DSM 5631 / JCM 9629 / NBRC 100127 / Av18) TaxID=572546 RepID=D2RHE5_ARCPA|nr:ATP-dependent protease LonB [Archaeoglobus profundus]ADB57720.1 peptidase S16, Lon-like protease [Archaeoglobus profundus DSM 5631]
MELSEKEIDELVGGLKFNTTADIEVPKRLIDQVIGQDHAVEAIKKAAVQKRHVMLIGSPGTGKSMLAKAMAELLPKEELEDILVFPNPKDPNQPLIRTVPAGEGRKIVERYKEEAMKKAQARNMLLFMLIFMLLGYVILVRPQDFIWGVIAAILLLMFSRYVMPREEKNIPKLLVDNADKETAPFEDATGAHAGALFGDVRHDPFQSFDKNNLIIVSEGNDQKVVKIGDFVNYIIEKHSDRVEERVLEDGVKYIAVDLRDFNYYTATLENGELKRTKILSVNKRIGEFKVIPVKHNGKLVILTPEHKVYTDKGLIEARNYKDQRIPSFKYTILTEEDIVRTYGSKELEKFRRYQEWLKFRARNPNVGYKRASKLLNFKASTLRWWYAGMKPISVKTVEELKHLGLVPLKSNDPRLPIIARIFGYALGDGNIDRNLNTFAIVSSKPEVLRKIAEDLREIFGDFAYEIRKNDSSIGNSYILRTTDRKIIRFFVALGFPIGKKTEQKLRVPEFVLTSEKTIVEFLRGLFDADGSVFSYGNKRYLEGTLTISVTVENDPDLVKNRREFLEDIKLMFGLFGIKLNAISEKRTERGKVILRLLISHEPKNVQKFIEIFRPVYNSDKSEKLVAGLNYIQSIRNNFREVNVTLKVKETYNITTETGNLLANGLLVKNSGGLETPAHERVEAGAIHRAHKGVLYIDEINTLTIESQQKLLTAMQEKKFPITGQSERSSGAMVRTEPVPCDFILVAAGNMDALMGMHPALRSRIEGYGYEVYMNDAMPDTPENRRKLVRFVAQEVIRDGKIPHFTREAVAEIIREARRRAGRRGHLTLRLRELGGLVRTAGDIAKSEGSDVVKLEHVLKAKQIAKTIEEQYADEYIERRKDYKLFKTEGSEVGRVNGLAVIGHSAGIVLPIIAEVTPAMSKEEGRVIATGRLQEIAQEAVMNVSAIIKKYTGRDISNYDIHIQFVGTYEGVEGDSASISVATAVISALENIPVDQSVAMTGSLSVRGDVLPVGGVTRKIEAAIQAGLKKVIIPKDNVDDVLLDAEHKGRIEIIPVSRIEEVLEHALVDCEKKRKLIEKLRAKH